MRKEMLIRESFEILALEAIFNCKTYKLNFREWIRNYGLYCSGKDINADVTKLGQALYNVELTRGVTTSERALIETTKESIAAELVLENSSLNLTPKK